MGDTQQRQDGDEGALLQHTRLLLQVQYASRLPPRSKRFKWPSDPWLLRAQSSLAEVLYGDAGSDEADATYDKTFLKALIPRLERAIAAHPDEEWEIEPLLLERYAELLAMPSSSTSAAISTTTAMDRLSCSLPFTSHAPPSDHIVEYWFPPHDSAAAAASAAEWRRIRLCEASTALVGSGTTACKTWEASLRLASHLLCHRDELLPRRGGDGGQASSVLELGSGTGLVSMLVAQLLSDNNHDRDSGRRPRSTPPVYATDLPVVVSSKLQPTLDLNDTSPHPQLRSLDWTDSSSSRALLEEVQPTLILGADIVFDPEICPHLVRVIHDALAASTTPPDEPGRAPMALIASTVRNASTYSRFLALLDEAGLNTEDVGLDRFEVRPPTASHDASGVPSILPFDSGHDEAVEGVVKGLRIWKMSS